MSGKSIEVFGNSRGCARWCAYMNMFTKLSAVHPRFSGMQPWPGTTSRFVASIMVYCPCKVRFLQLVTQLLAV